MPMHIYSINRKKVQSTSKPFTTTSKLKGLINCDESAILSITVFEDFELSTRIQIINITLLSADLTAGMLLQSNQNQFSSTVLPFASTQNPDFASLVIHTL